MLSCSLESLISSEECQGRPSHSKWHHVKASHQATETHNTANSPTRQTCFAVRLLAEVSLKLDRCNLNTLLLSSRTSAENYIRKCFAQTENTWKAQRMFTGNDNKDLFFIVTGLLPDNAAQPHKLHPKEEKGMLCKRRAVLVMQKKRNACYTKAPSGYWSACLAYRTARMPWPQAQPRD